MSVLPRRQFGFNRRDGCVVGKPIRPGTAFGPCGCCGAAERTDTFGWECGCADQPMCRRCGDCLAHCECDDGPLWLPASDPGLQRQ